MLSLPALRSDWILFALAALALLCILVGADIHTALGFTSGCVAGGVLIRLDREDS